MVNCAECGKKIGLFENTEKDKEGKDVCMSCKKKLDEKEIQHQSMQQKKLKGLKEQEEKELEKNLIKEYGGKFQADAIRELIQINAHVKQIRSFCTWIFIIVLIAIIITVFSSCLHTLP